ncbi:MAG: hypothetical protein H0U57_06625 [Tatlockia sp.]|nr:hypothetical protein [Tatlockia sp.]
MQEKKLFQEYDYLQDLERLKELGERLVRESSSEEEDDFFNELWGYEEDDEEYNDYLREANEIINRLVGALDSISLNSCSNQSEVVQLAHDITEKPKFTHDGRLPNNSEGELPRFYRNFSSDREKQILRHIASQCYFYLQSNGVQGLVEVQAMHLVWGDKHTLFIVANQFNVTQRFSELITRDNFKAIFTTAYNLIRPTSESLLRSQRYTSKIRNKVLGDEIIIEGDDVKDLENAKSIGKLLRTNNVWLLKMTYEKNVLDNTTRNCINNAINQNGIYFVQITGHSNKQRHAEEFLCDIVEYANSTQNNLEFTSTAIAGRKRPCIGCSGRMKNLISNYNQFPGRFWTHTIKHQPKHAQLETIKLLREGSSYNSVYKDGSRGDDFDSGSDSEEPFQNLMKI